MLTVGRVLTTNVSPINIGQFLFRYTLKVRLGSGLSLHLKWTTWTVPKLIHFSKKNHSSSAQPLFTTLVYRNSDSDSEMFF